MLGFSEAFIITPMKFYKRLASPISQQWEGVPHPESQGAGDEGAKRREHK